MTYFLAWVCSQEPILLTGSGTAQPEPNIYITCRNASIDICYMFLYPKSSHMSPRNLPNVEGINCRTRNKVLLPDLKSVPLTPSSLSSFLAYRFNVPPSLTPPPTFQSSFHPSLHKSSPSIPESPFPHFAQDFPINGPPSLILSSLSTPSLLHSVFPCLPISFPCVFYYTLGVTVCAITVNRLVCLVGNYQHTSL